MRGLALITVLVLGGCMSGRVMLSDNSPGLARAADNFPPMIVGDNNTPTDNALASMRHCPASGGVVEQKGGPTMEFLGANPANPDMCLMRVGGDMVQGWYGIWLTIWPGVEKAYPALTRVMQGGAGDIVGFDNYLAFGFQYHDLIRNEGVEDIILLGTHYHALRLAHYREGYDGNDYRSVSTVWKDLASGLLIYGTYQHISGRPVVDDPIIPTRIAPAP